MALKPTPRVRRLKRHREYALIWIKVRRGETKISQQLMQSITSPKWKIKIAEAAILYMVQGPSKDEYLAGLRGGIQIIYPTPKI
jgi:hypothetical protein